MAQHCLSLDEVTVLKEQLRPIVKKKAILHRYRSYAYTQIVTHPLHYFVTSRDKFKMVAIDLKSLKYILRPTLKENRLFVKYGIENVKRVERMLRMELSPKYRYNI